MPCQCAWPFQQPIYGQQMPSLTAPNSDVGVDGMVINAATVLTAVVTNPFIEGCFQGPAQGFLGRGFSRGRELLIVEMRCPDERKTEGGIFWSF